MKIIPFLLSFAFLNVVFSQEMISVPDFMKVRCFSDSNEQAYFQWKGYAYVQKPASRERLVFEVLGMNVARCIKKDDMYSLVTREMQLYLDPATGEIIDQWENPWTGDTVPVMHVANSPVQIPLPAKASLPLDDLGPTKSVGFYFPLAYKNPLSDQKYQDYAPAEWYQASEMFRFHFLPEDPTNAGLVWNRMGQFLPWMKMRDHEGILKIVAHGKRMKSFQSLDPRIKTAIENRAPSYKNAPECIVQQKNATSWTEFKKHFDAYEDGEIFPKDAEPLNCK